MSWARLDDGYWSDPDLESVSLAALGVFSRSISYCACHNTDGHLPEGIAQFLARSQKKLVRELVDEGLWEKVDDDFKVWNWSRYQGGSDRDPIPPWLRDAVVERDGMVCGLCGGEIAQRTDLHIDHVHPVAAGGKTLLMNLQPAHAYCNMSKGAKW